MKKIMMVGAAVLAGAMVTGCMTGKGHSDWAKEYEEFKAAKKPATFVLTGDKALDDMGVLSAQLYETTYNLLVRYVAATENNRYYLGFVNDIQVEMDTTKCDKATAMQKLLKEYQDADAVRPAGEEKVYPRVVEGWNAVQALKPMNQLKELAPLAGQAAKAASSASGLANSFKGFDPSTLKKAASVVKISEQLAFSSKAIAYLTVQYNRNCEMENYMKK